MIFTILGFVSGYAVRKQAKIECPKSIVNINEVADEVKEGSIINNDCSNTTEQKKIYTYDDLVGLYTYNIDLKLGEDGNAHIHYSLYLNSDGTFIYNNSYHSGAKYMGNYIIDGDKIILNYWFKGWHEPLFTTVSYTSIVNIISEDELVDTNIIGYSDLIGTNEIKLTRDNDEEKIARYGLNFKDNLNNAELHNDYTDNN